MLTLRDELGCSVLAIIINNWLRGHRARRPSGEDRDQGPPLRPGIIQLETEMLQQISSFQEMFRWVVLTKE